MEIVRDGFGLGYEERLYTEKSENKILGRGFRGFTRILQSSVWLYDSCN